MVTSAEKMKTLLIAAVPRRCILVADNNRTSYGGCVLRNQNSHRKTEEEIGQ